MIKNDEIQLVKMILAHCETATDPRIPTEEILQLDIHPKRLYYLLTKFWFIEYGVSVLYGWLDASPAEIKDYYKNAHGVQL